MKTGVVLELSDGKAVVLDGSGAFRSVPAGTAWRPGDVVPLAGERRRVHWALPLAACLTLILAGTGWLWMTPAALVSLDVNPSVELTLNRFDRVVNTRALNDDGAGLLAAGGVNGMAAGQAVAALLGSDYLEPYLERENSVTLTVQADDPALADKLLPLVERTAASAVDAGTAVSCHGVDAGTVAAAHGCGVTAGKYLALLELRAADPDIDITEYAHCGIGEIEEQTERCHAAISGDSASDLPGSGCGKEHQHSGRH